MAKRQAPAAERKLVTVLFADLTGFTSLCETLDAEDVTDFLLPAMAELRGDVEAFGGTVVQVSGDGFLAVFGAPRAQEDHAERAVRAALAARDRARALGRSARALLPELHAGINTGEVFVSPSDDRAGFTVYGDAVNVASRLCALAPGGAVLAGPRSRSLAGDAVVFSAPRRRRLKGRTELVAVSEAIRPRAALPAPRSDPRAPAPFVGRDAPLRVLIDVVKKATSQRRSQMLVVTGDAGIGKSRLAEELRARLTDADVVRGRCSPYGATLPISALAEAIARRAGVEPDTPRPFAALQRFTRSLGVPAPQALAKRIATMCGIDDASANPSRPEDVSATARTVLAALAARRPVVVIIDDAHWADADLVRLLSSAAATPWEMPVAFIVLSRPPAPKPLAHRPALKLDSLTDDAIRSLVRARLRGASADLAARIAQRAGGNPLFCEEMIGMLLDAGALQPVKGSWRLVDEAALAGVPETLGGLIGGRIDLLEPETKRLLQYAACGTETWDRLLLDLQPDGRRHLERLEASGLLVRRPHSAMPRCIEYELRHPLIRDVAQRSLPRRERANVHARAGDWIRKQAVSAQSDEPVDVLAYHYEQAHLLSGGAADVAATAAAYLCRSAQNAFRHQARLAESIFTRALAIRDVPADLRAEGLSGRAEALLELGRHAEARRDAAKARSLAPKAGRLDVVARALLTEGGSLSDSGIVARARPLLEQSRRTFAAAGDSRGVADALLRLAGTYRLDDMAQCIDVLRQSREAALDAGDHWARAHAAQELALVLSAVGGREFLDRYAEASTLIGDDANLRLRASLLRTGAYRSLLVGDYEQAVVHAVDARRLAAEAGSLGIEADARLVEATARAALGPPTDAIAAARDIVPLARLLRSKGLRALAALAEALPQLRSGSAALASSRIAGARRTLETIKQPAQLAEADMALAAVMLDRGRWDDAVAPAHDAERRARSVGFVAYAPQARLLAARAHLGAGRYAQAADDAAAAGREAADTGATHIEAFARACADQARLLAGGTQRAPGASGRPARSAGAARSPAHRGVVAENAGLLARARGREDEAGRHFADAAAAWQRLGQTVWLARAKALEASVRPRARKRLLAQASVTLRAVGAPPQSLSSL